MSPRDKFDRFMADVRNGTNFKLASLSHAHYRAFFSAVLPIAAMSKVRGAFMVNGEPATAEQMRLMAPKLTLKECQSALEIFRAVGLLEHDEDLGAEWVHDFEEWNPEPKRDATSADRQKRYRDRMRGRDVTRESRRNGRDGNALAREEVEVEVTPPSPSVEFEEWIAHHEQTTGHKPPGRATKAFHSIVASYEARRAEDYTADELKLATIGAHADDHRRQNGYDTPDSVLRPMKVASLVAKGKLRTGSRGTVTSAELGQRLRGGDAA